MSNVDWTPLYDIADPAQAVTYYYTVMNTLISDSVPIKRRKKGSGDRYIYPAWYTLDIIRAIRIKAKWHKKYKSSKSGDDYKVFSKWRSNVKSMIAYAHEQYTNKIEQNLEKEPKSFWCYIKAKTGAVSRKTITKDGMLLSDPECATEFANFFRSVFGDNTAQLDVAACSANGVNSASVHLSQLSRLEVRAALARLTPKRSAGPDGIPSFVIRDCRIILEKPLHHIYKVCLDASYFPDFWKVTKVVPIPKEGGGTDVSCFRPVAILSAPAKVFEIALQNSLRRQVAAQLTDAQHGFRPARSTTSNLLEAMTYIVPHVDAGVQVDAAYFDFKKAFDLVDNDVLLSKLAAVGCTNKLLGFFASYMRERKQYVEYAGYRSEPYVTKTGVSQGSNLGPLKFLVLINDLPEVIRDARCLLFADDLKLLLAVRHTDDCKRLQEDVNRVVEWSKINKLEFNTAKCQVLSYSRSLNPLHYDYKIGLQPLQRIEEVKDLGVYIKRDLAFGNHIMQVCKKAYRRLGFVLRRTADLKNIGAISRLYDALVRSQLECNSAVWAPHEHKYKLMLEKIQNKFTRYLYWRLYGVYPLYPLMYPTLFVLGMVGYNKLEVRRDWALAYYMVRVLRGVISHPELLSIMTLCVPDEYVSRRRRPPLLSVPHARTNLLAKAPPVRMLQVLNRVAQNIDLFASSVPELKRAVFFDRCYSNNKL